MALVEWNPRADHRLMHGQLPGVVCESCYEDIREYVEAEEVGIATDVDPPPQYDPCALCRQELNGQSYFSLKSVGCPQPVSTAIQNEVCACDAAACCSDGDATDKEWFLNDLNSDVLTVFSAHVASLNESDRYAHLLKWLRANGSLEAVEFPGIACPKCSSALVGWFQEVKTPAWRRILPAVPPLPPEITSLPIAALRPEEVIEYYRSDCSDSLIHLTRPSELAYLESNVPQAPKSRRFAAGEVLFLILVQRVLRAAQGKGLHAQAVCFTEKPLTALKDTLLGRESLVRRERAAITWAPYGLMFRKTYLRELGAAPVLHLDAREESSVPSGLRHRVVPFSAHINWNHEREWRCGGDVTFDPAEAVVLLPRFEHVASFKKALDDAKVAVRGFLPLFDLFASM